MSADWRKLAIFGHPPAFAEPVHVGRPNLGDRGRFLERMEDILDRRAFSNHGKYEREFAAELRRVTGAKHCIPVDNATRGLEIAMAALGMDGEVIVPAFTFAATPHAVAWRGATPVFADVLPDTHTLDPASVEASITERTSGIVGVHLWGQPCATEALQKIANRRGLALVFDAAHALGCSDGSRPIGTFGDAEVFSFHATKFVNSFEGGAIATDDDGVAERARLMTSFGMRDGERAEMLGTNGKLSEPAAAMGLTSLESMGAFVETNRRNFECYARLLDGIDGIALFEPGGDRPNYQYVVITVDHEAAGLDRDALRAVLHAENVLAKRYFHPGCHRMEPYSSRSEQPHLPITDMLAARVLCLPTGTGVSSQDIETICRIVRTAVSHATEIGRARG